MTTNYKTFYLTKEEYKFLKRYIIKLKFSKIKFSYTKNVYLLELNPIEQSSLIDDLTNTLVSTGLDEEDEPNKIGSKIENLIDVFNPYKN